MLFFLLVQFRPRIRQNPYFLLLVKPPLNFLSHMHEHLLYILPGLGAGLEEVNSHLLGQSLPLLVPNPPIAHIRLIPHKNFHDIVRCVQFDLFDPVLDVVKTFPFVNGVSEYDAHGSPIVGLCDGFKFLLACGIPNLQPDFFLANHEGFGFEVDADGGEMRGHKVILAVFKKHIGLADSTIPND